VAKLQIFGQHIILSERPTMLSLINENISDFSQIAPNSSSTLILHCNKIKTFQSLQGEWTSLSVLDISSNFLTSTIGLHKLPNLVSLNLSNNLLEALVEIPRALQILDVSFNKLKQLNKEQLRNLQSLDIHGNPLTISPYEVFAMLPKLTRLDGLNMDGDEVDEPNVLQESSNDRPRLESREFYRPHSRTSPRPVSRTHARHMNPLQEVQDPSNILVRLSSLERQVHNQSVTNDHSNLENQVLRLVEVMSKSIPTDQKPEAIKDDRISGLENQVSRLVDVISKKDDTTQPASQNPIAGLESQISKLVDVVSSSVSKKEDLPATVHLVQNIGKDRIDKLEEQVKSLKAKEEEKENMRHNSSMSKEIDSSDDAVIIPTRVPMNVQSTYPGQTKSITAMGPRR
jgi:Leucine-rich repeat (LRR) protein